MKNKILVLTDLTETAGTALKQATTMARRVNASLVLIHVITDDSSPTELVEMNLNTKATRIRKLSGLKCETMLIKGPFLQAMENLTCENDHCLMVVGTQGIHGIKQRLWGANILKLVSRVHMPVLVVQEGAPLVEEFRRIVLPVASHASFHSAISAAVMLASYYDSEVHLYSIRKEGFEWPDQLLKNIEDATNTLANRKIRMKRVKEEQTVYSQGYAKQTLNYAKSAKADAICIMSIPSKEYYYFAQSDKESILLNDFSLPVLCAGGGRDEGK
jgi:nucleotide-binding universal stress UspA family protein